MVGAAVGAARAILGVAATEAVAGQQAAGAGELGSGFGLGVAVGVSGVDPKVEPAASAPPPARCITPVCDDD